MCSLKSEPDSESGSSPIVRETELNLKAQTKCEFLWNCITIWQNMSIVLLWRNHTVSYVIFPHCFQPTDGARLDSESLDRSKRVQITTRSNSSMELREETVEICSRINNSIIKAQTAFCSHIWPVWIKGVKGCAQLRKQLLIGWSSSCQDTSRQIGLHLLTRKSTNETNGETTLSHAASRLPRSGSRSWQGLPQLLCG